MRLIGTYRSVRAMIESDYDYRYERKKAKPIKMCNECHCDLYAGEKVFVIGNKVYCDDCVREVILEDE